jgi:hypothetical protein
MKSSILAPGIKPRNEKTHFLDFALSIQEQSIELTVFQLITKRKGHAPQVEVWE